MPAWLMALCEQRLARRRGDLLRTRPWSLQATLDQAWVQDWTLQVHMVIVELCWHCAEQQLARMHGDLLWRRLWSLQASLDQVAWRLDLPGTHGDRRILLALCGATTGT